MGKKAPLIQILVFVVFIGALLVLHLVLPDSSLSGRESLQTAPKLTLKTLTSGRFMEQAETYTGDQFPFRSGWVSLKARAELLSGRTENNGVYLCAGERLLEAFPAPTDQALKKQTDAVRAFAESVEVPVAFALIPTAGGVYRDALPAGAPNDDQQAVIDAAYKTVGCETVDLSAVLNEHRNEDIFYRTDHHWTSLGAYYGYCALGDVLGYEPLPRSAFTERTVSEDFYGTAWSNSGFSWVKPDAITACVEQGGAVIARRTGAKVEEIPLYDESALDGIDQYSYFYGGNTPLLTVETGNEGERLLILRDSYMDSLSPFLFAHFFELHIVDLRYYKSSIRDYIRDNGIDRVLICYGINNFISETNLFLLENHS